VTFPTTWHVQDQPVVERQPDHTSTFDGLNFTPTNGEKFAFLIELVPVKTNVPDAELKTLMETRLPAGLPGEKPSIQELKTQQGTGYYWVLTDPRPTLPAGEFRYMTEGFAQLGPLLLSFRLVNDDHAAEAKALEVVRSARITKP